MMPPETGRWAVSAEIDLVENRFTDEDLFQTKYAIHKYVYDTPLAPGLEPMSSDIIAERTPTGVRIGFHVRAAAERDAWDLAVPFVVQVVLDHPSAKGWAAVSIPRIKVELTEL